MNDDTISRQAAIGAICNACGKIDCDQMDTCGKIDIQPINSSEIPNISDTISRKAAIDAVGSMLRRKFGIGGDLAEITLADLPSAQQEKRTDKCTETHSCDCISRKEAIDAVKKNTFRLTFAEEQNCEGHVAWSAEAVYSDVMEGALLELPSAQPEQTNSWYINSWCNNCKEYDKENKCCPRYNRVIKQTLDDAYRHGETEAEARFHAQQRWIPCSERLPEERQEILATTTDNAWGDVVIIRTYYKEMHKSVIAWMPLPEPYAERRTDVDANT